MHYAIIFGLMAAGKAISLDREGRLSYREDHHLVLVDE